MLLYFSLTGILLSIIFLYFNARRYASSIYVGVFFFLLSLYGITQYAILYSKSVFFVAVSFTNSVFLLYLIGPMLYMMLSEHSFSVCKTQLPVIDPLVILAVQLDLILRGLLAAPQTTKTTE